MYVLAQLGIVSYEEVFVNEQVRLGIDVGYAHALGLPILVYAPIPKTTVHPSLLHPALGMVGTKAALGTALPELIEISKITTIDRTFAEAVVRFQTAWKTCIKA